LPPAGPSAVPLALPAVTTTVFLDAFGTILGLDPPVPRLCARLADEGYPSPIDLVGTALWGEMRYYREHLDEGRDAASLADLRRRCAAVLGDGLADGAPPLDVLTGCLVDSLEFVLLPDAPATLDTLRAAGLRLAMVSNWDYTLPHELERLGIAHAFEEVAVSATLGVAKPHPSIFRWTMREMGVSPDEVVHCGDHPEKDCAGARAAGIRAVLVDRDNLFPDAPYPRIRSLTDLPHRLASPR
jgi:putative hydrolase of the HAD superfamily